MTDDRRVDKVLSNLQLMREDLSAAQSLDRMKSVHLGRLEDRLQMLTRIAKHMKTAVSQDEKRIQRLRRIADERERQ